MPLSIRPASAADEAETIALWQACGLVAPHNDPATDFRFARAGAASDILVGTDETGAVRASVLVGHDGHRGWLYYVATDPDQRGHGHGRAIVTAAKDWLRQRGVWKVQLMVRDTNIRVVPFYERLGFRVEPRVVMSRRLDGQP